MWSYKYQVPELVFTGGHYTFHRKRTLTLTTDGTPVSHYGTSGIDQYPLPAPYTHLSYPSYQLHPQVRLRRSHPSRETRVIMVTFQC